MADSVKCYEDVVRQIRYVVISVSWACSLFTIIVITAEKLYVKPLKNIVLLIQIMYLLLCSAILTYYPGLNRTHCSAQAYIYYFSWFVHK
jgi:hypothetical protein